MKDPLRIVIYGASGNALSMAQELCLGEPPDLLCDIVAYIDDFEANEGSRRWDRPLITFDMWRYDYADVPCFLAMGSPHARRVLRDKVGAAGGRFATVHNLAPLSRLKGIVIGEDCYVGRFVGFGHRVSIGSHVHIYPLCSIGNEVIIGDFCSLFPSCTIGDHVILEHSVFVGAGVTIQGGTAAHPVVIGAGARIWAGSVVTQSVAAGVTIAGHPARGLRDLVRERTMAAARRPFAATVSSQH